MAVTRKIYVSILLCMLVTTIIDSFLKAKSEPSAFEEREIEHEAVFPSFTICPRINNGTMDNFTEFQDIYKALEHFKQHGFSATFEYLGKGVQGKKYDLKNEEILATKFNTTLDKVWDYAVIVQPDWPPKRMILCVTLNVPKVDQPRQGEHKLFLETTIDTDGKIRKLVSVALIKLSKFKSIFLEISGAFYYERHEPGNSRQNFDFDKTSGFDMLGNWEKTLVVLKETQTTSMKKSTHDCYEDNSMKMTNCMNDFYAEQLGCKLPWASKSTMKTLNICQTGKELEAFKEMGYHITSQKLKSKVEKYGCLKPNCKTTTWTETTYTENWKRSRPGHTHMVVIPFNAKVLQRQEVSIANYITFVADCGSYLGLFLGASLLTIIDLLITSWQKSLEVVKALAK